MPGRMRSAMQSATRCTAADAVIRVCDNLGVAYEFGLGVPKNLGKARELYQKAADQNNEHAKEGLNRLSRGVGSIP